ncbi:RNA polymerase, sigma subunit, ECF family [Magnetococcus marinus MC-1]|uniref:RNA polymerase sigma factor n=1 Tax=Magnetococcus marinus (strain ATCC BAA-1437 / JCM 17883 / MC-1) TaxID=156889 RepID=A0LD14_MAGMM|nr:RNA polymerase sigma factor [Magnetococcus marinus]ABK45857.1 RNA polymerase, sigma subunit, ECF family [Magnetococcus marinus MC-1]
MILPPPFEFMPNDPDAAHLKQALNGHPEAYALVVRRLQVRVYHFVLRHIHSPEDAEDLTQETFLEAYRNLSRFQGNSLFSTWLLGIAHNMARNFRGRAPHYRYDITDDSVLEYTSDDRPTPHDYADEADRMKLLKRAMEQLPEEQREALTLISLEELSYEEAAVVADISLSALKTRVFRARKHLRELLHKGGVLDQFEPQERGERTGGRL